MIGTDKKKIKEFVERSIANYKESNGYAVISVVPEEQQNFINGKLYNLYIEAEKSSSQSTLQVLKEVLNEYPGFSSYFAKHQEKPQQKAPDLPWCEYVGNPAARRFWGLDPLC